MFPQEHHEIMKHASMFINNSTSIPALGLLFTLLVFKIFQPVAREATLATENLLRLFGLHGTSLFGFLRLCFVSPAGSEDWKGCSSKLASAKSFPRSWNEVRRQDQRES